VIFYRLIFLPLYLFNAWSECKNFDGNRLNELFFNIFILLSPYNRSIIPSISWLYITCNNFVLPFQNEEILLPFDSAWKVTSNRCFSGLRLHRLHHTLLKFFLPQSQSGAPTQSIERAYTINRAPDWNFSYHQSQSGAPTQSIERHQSQSGAPSKSIERPIKVIVHFSKNNTTF
jgi:hypothetical protein